MRVWFSFLLLLLVQSQLAIGEERPEEVQVADPYLELHTGAGSGYPVFYVVDRGEWIAVLKRRTDWFLVRTQRGKEGWVVREQLARTLTPSGNSPKIKSAKLEDFSSRSWELGMGGGRFEGAPTISIYGGYAFSENLSAELTLSKVLGNFSASDVIKASLVAQPFPEWRYSPFFSVGSGYIKTKARTSLIQPLDRSNQFATIGVGVRTYITRRIVFRLEYNDYVIFSANNNKDENEDIGEWKAGFTLFF